MYLFLDCKQCAHMDTNVQTNHPIDCSKYTPFWVSWTNNVIKVGKGNDVGKQQFMSWNDTAPHDVNYVAFSTGFGASGKWKVTRGSCNIRTRNISCFIIQQIYVCKICKSQGPSSLVFFEFLR